MNNIFLIIFLLILITYIIFKKKKNENFTNVINNYKIVNSYDCYLEKCNLNPMQSYKQNTNNYPLINYKYLSKFPCNNTNNSQPDNNRKIDVDNIHKINNDITNNRLYPINNVRVNFWNCNQK